MSANAHPARRARTAVAVASGAGLLVLTGCMAAARTTSTPVRSTGTSGDDQVTQTSPTFPTDDGFTPSPGFPQSRGDTSSRGS